MIYKSQVYTEASGSIGGVVYSHNRGGLYTRARTIPCNPNSAQQMAIRAMVAGLTNHWKLTLMPGQRDAWAWYADQVLIPNALGDPKKIPPLAHYIRSNVPRILGGFLRKDDGPVNFNLGQFTPPAIVKIDATADKIEFSLTIGDEWNVTGGGLILYTSRPQNPTIGYFKGPYRFATSVAGPGAGTPQTKDLAFPCTVGQLIYAMWRFTQADGRLSLPFRAGKIAVAGASDSDSGEGEAGRSTARRGLRSTAEARVA